MEKRTATPAAARFFSPCGRLATATAAAIAAAYRQPRSLEAAGAAMPAGSPK